MKQHISKPQIGIVAKPYVMALRVTNRCMTACDHCSGGYGPVGDDMEEDLFFRACSEAKVLGIMTAHITGGEPLLHPRLESLIAIANAEGLIPELVTSLYAPGQLPAVQRLEFLCRAGLRRVMVSFDDPHSERVTIDDLATFLLSATSLGLDTGVNVVEWGGSKWDVEGVRRACSMRSVPVRQIDWCASHLSMIGRAASARSCKFDNSTWARCAFSLTSPTVDPDGVVLVCCSSTRDQMGFVIGDLSREDFRTCIGRLLMHPLCRANALIGPNQTWLALGFPEDEMPGDACVCCFALSSAFGDKEMRARLESISSAFPEFIAMDYDALNTWCRKAVPPDAPRIGNTQCPSSKSN